MYRTVNMNSTHSLGFKVRREELFRILKTLGMLVLYDSTHYPGVNLKYMYNAHNRCRDGRCHCYDGEVGEDRGKKCIKTRGDGNALRQCRPITVSIYNSGSILFTGTRNYAQLREAYRFIMRVCREHRSSVEADAFELEPTTDDIGF